MELQTQETKKRRSKVWTNRDSVVLTALVLLLCLIRDTSGSWEEWWTYDGISGPLFWGLVNPQWNMCIKGMRQSPINVEPDKLLFDPGLRDFYIDKHKVSGILHNTGQSLVFHVDKESKQHVNISGGPLAYRYQFEEIYFHYGIENHHGSEHHIHGYAFPGEIQLYGFNKNLYHNMSEAQHRSQGIVGISLMVQIGDTPNPELRIFTSAFNQVLYRGKSTPIRHVSLKALLPDTRHYITYEGSTTHPGCWETTVWIIINKPIYITKQEYPDAAYSSSEDKVFEEQMANLYAKCMPTEVQHIRRECRNIMYALRRLMQGSEETPKAPLGNNARPLQSLHHRTIRTNINFNKSKDQPIASCPPIFQDMQYEATVWPIDNTTHYRTLDDLYRPIHTFR